MFKHITICLLLTLSWILLPQGSSAQFAAAVTSAGGNFAAGKSVTSDENNDSYVTGFFENTIDFSLFGGNFLVSSYGPRAAYVVKMNSGGGFLWSAMIESSGGPCVGEDIVYDDQDHLVYVTGRFEGTLDVYDSGGILAASVTGFGGEDVFVAVYNQAGNFLNLIIGGGPGDDGGEGLTVNTFTSANIVGLTGYMTTSMVFKNYLGTILGNITVNTATGTRDAFVAVFKPMLNVMMYIGDIEGPGNEVGYGVGFNGVDELFVTGEMGSQIRVLDGAGGLSPWYLGTGGGQDSYLGKFQVGGALSWFTIQGSGMDDMGYDVIVTAGAGGGGYDGLCVITGRYQADLAATNAAGTTVLGAPHLCTGGINQMFVMGYTNAGTPFWVDWVESCGGSLGATNGSIGQSMSYQGLNFDIMYVTGQVEGPSIFYEGVGGGVINIPTSFGTEEDVESVVIRIDVPYLTGNYSASRIFANNGDFFNNDYDPGFGIDCSNFCSVFLTGTFQGLNAEFNPFTQNPGFCGVPSCTNQMYWGNVNCGFWKTENAGLIQNDLESASSVTLFPNPGNGMLFVAFSDPAVAGTEMRVFDLNGRMLLDGTVQEGMETVSLDLQSFAAGMYWVEVRSPGFEPVRIKYMKD